MSNKKIGNDFEIELCNKLAENGWWVTRLAPSSVGQPSDIIAVKNNFPLLIDAKVCSNDKFELSRIEPNQESSMTLWEERGNIAAYFAMKLQNGEIYMISFDSIKIIESFNRKSITDFSIFLTLDQFLDLIEGRN